MHRVRSMLPGMTIVLMVILLCSNPFTILAADDLILLDESHFAAKSMQWDRLDDGTYRLNLSDGRGLGVTGEPDLPALDLLFLVPTHWAVTDVLVEPLSVRLEGLPGRLATAPPIRTSTGELAEQKHLAAVDGVFPALWGSFGGLHSWHGYRLLAVTVHPVRLHQATEHKDAYLEFLEHFAIHAVTESGRQMAPPLTRMRAVPGERQRLETTLRRMVANPGAVGGYVRSEGALLDKQGAPHLPTPNPSLEGSGVRFLIVTSADLADEFQRLADHRTAQGLPAKVVTREWIEATHRNGIDFQETLRMYLQEAYVKWGMEFLLIGGDTEIIPTRFIRSTFYGPQGFTILPTDRYYACLDGNWNANGNGWLAETSSMLIPSDDADLAPELAIGRAPVRTALGVHQFVDKVITYDSAQSDAPFTNSVLIAAEELFSYLDGALYAHQLNEEIIQPCSDMGVMRMYASDIDTLPRDMPLNLENFIVEADSGAYGQICHFGHGHFYNLSMSNQNFTNSHADALNNAPGFFLIYGLNCSSAAYDVSCISSRLVANPQGGSIVSIGSAREAFPSNSFLFMKAFYQDMVCNGSLRTGDAINAALMQYVGQTSSNTVFRWTNLNMVILGDPTVSIWNGLPVSPQISAPASVSTGEQTIQITVTAGGMPVIGTDVCLIKEDETYAWSVTDAAGNAWMDVLPETAGSLTLAVSGKGLVWTTDDIPVVGGSTYVSLKSLSIDDSASNGNGIPEAGETISLEIELQDVGGGGATDLNLSITSSNPDLVVLSGTSAAPDIPPGGSVMALEPIVIQTPTSMGDGTSIPLRVEVTSGGGGNWVSRGEIEILAPEPEMVRLIIDDSVYGNGDGIPQSNERLVLRPYVKNYGAGRVDQLLIQIEDPAPGVEVHGSMALLLGIDALDEETYLSGELSLTLEDIDMIEPARLTFVDNYGRGFDHFLEFNPPEAPALPVADASLAVDKITLRWDPVGEGRTLGYHVYRAENPAGPFVRANQDLLRGVSYFEDSSLEQLTMYWYKVTSVDTFFVEGEASPIVEQGTMPAEIQNFPLTFGAMTSSHLAVGDVTGDGRKEIILAADELYAWRDDGTELLDGDDDPQTTGPFTNFGGGFSPAGVVLARMESGPQLQIIASLAEPARQIHIYRADGTMMPGWPRTLQGSSINWNWATPAVGDVTGDGNMEVVVNDREGRTYVWRHDGTELMDGDDDPNTDGVFVVRPEAWGLSSPALYDLDGDGAREIIFGTRYDNGDNALLAYKSDGTQAPGFPYLIGSPRIICSPTIADLDGSGTKEIIFFASNRRLYVLRADGTIYPGFPVLHSGNHDHDPGPSPAVGDFTGDGHFEIVWPVNGGTILDLLIVDLSGNVLDGWPVTLPSRTEGSPVVGDINGDGLLNIIMPAENGHVYAYNRDGTTVAGFPIRLSGPCRTAPVVCDLNSDGKVNVVYGSGDQLLHVWSMPYDHNLGLVPWPTFRGNNCRTGEARVVSASSVTEPDVPSAFTIVPPFPNPFNPSTTIELYVAPETNPALDVAVFDLRGRLVRQLFTGSAQPGWRRLTWDGRDDDGRQVGSGVYFVQARQADRTHTFKVALVK